MKYILPFLVLVFFAMHSYAQKALTFNEAKEQGLSIEYLDSIYVSGIHSDTTLAVFKTNQEEYASSYQKLLQDLGKYLKANNFFWDKPVKGFNRIYFQKDGKIDYFIYSFRPEQLSVEQEKRFGSLLSQFIQSYSFPLKADKKFAQCSPVTYMPAEK